MGLLYREKVILLPFVFMNPPIEILFYLVVFGLLAVSVYQWIYRNLEAFQLKCIVSTVDGEKYCVRERDRVQEAADLLAKVTEKCKNLVDYMGSKYLEDVRVKQLVERFNPKTIMETLPTSEFTAYSENKGEKVAFCLNKKKEDDDALIDEHTLTFVSLHELTHIMTASTGHGDDFWENFKYLLECAKEAGIHDPMDYKNKPTSYCGMTIRDNPYYDV
jgi:hypothetical protein